MKHIPLCLIALFTISCSHTDNKKRINSTKQLVQLETFGFVELCQYAKLPKRISESYARLKEKYNANSCEKLYETLKDKKDITLKYDSVADLAPFERLHHLESIHIEQRDAFDSFPDLSGLTKLKKISILHARFRNYENISTLRHTKLESLTLGLSFNRDQSLISLQKMTEYLPALKTLRELSITNAELEDISFVKKFPNVSSLSLYNNKIKNIEVVKHLKKLKTFWIKDNQVESIAALKNHPELRFFYFNNNRIKDISVLLTLSRLREFWSYTNPLSEKSKKIFREIRVVSKK